MINQKIPILSGIFNDNPDKILDEIELFGKKYKKLIFLLPSLFTQAVSEEGLRSFFVNILDGMNVSNKIILYNNPKIFAGNNISQELLNKLLNYPNIIGIKDSSEKFGNYKGYIQNISQDFTVCCGKERQFSHFLQLIPREKREYSALVPSISNIINTCKKLYSAALEDEPLKIVQYQEAINEFRDKLYDVQNKSGKQQRGLKYALYTLYKDSIDMSYNDAMNFSPEFKKPVEKTTQNRIAVTAHYLLNLNYIDKLYPMGNEFLTFHELKEKFSKEEDLNDLGILKRIKGPYGREEKINIIYRMKFEQDLVFRYYDSISNKNSIICPEKLLYPFLDGTLHWDAPGFRERIVNILSRIKGNYIFDVKKPPLIPVPNLVYFDESKSIFPFIYSIQEYISGKPFYHYKKRIKIENLELELPKLINFFRNAGKILAKIHGIDFDLFYEDIMDIGKNSSKKSWHEIIEKEFGYLLTEAKKNKLSIVGEIKDYLKEHQQLLDDEYEPVLIHNNFHGQNIVIKDEQTAIKVNAILDFKKWRVGVRAMDFAPIQYKTLKIFQMPELRAAFHEGYEKYYGKRIDRQFLRKIEIYKLFFFLEEFNKNPLNSNFKREIHKILIEK